MTRTAARELSVRLVYELTFSDLRAEALLRERLQEEYFSDLSGEDDLYEHFSPEEQQLGYIRTLVSGVDAHGPELDDYIARYAIGWDFSRISRIASSIMRVAMFEILYLPEVPPRAAVNEALEIAKKYEGEETMAFINGILGSFIRKECAEDGGSPGERAT